MEIKIRIKDLLLLKNKLINYWIRNLKNRYLKRVCQVLYLNRKINRRRNKIKNKNNRKIFSISMSNN